eukprot:s429_g6.t1
MFPTSPLTGRATLWCLRKIERRDGWETASSMIIVILVVSISAGGVISCLCVGMYMYVQRERYASSVGTEDQEIVERSEGGYRTKRKVIPGKAPEPRKESKPGCLSKCYRRLCPKKQIRRIAPVMEESAGILVVGAHVRLVGLSQAHFNGLEGYVTGAFGVRWITCLCCHLSMQTTIRLPTCLAVGPAPIAVAPRTLLRKKSIAARWGAGMPPRVVEAQAGNST